MLNQSVWLTLDKPALAAIFWLGRGREYVHSPFDRLAPEHLWNNLHNISHHLILMSYWFLVPDPQHHKPLAVMSQWHNDTVCDRKEFNRYNAFPCRHIQRWERLTCWIFVWLSLAVINRTGEQHCSNPGLKSFPLTYLLTFEEIEHKYQAQHF